MRKRALLIVGLALLMATAGVVYAHWTDTLEVNATVYTGNVNVRWVNVFTDDDGAPVIGEEPAIVEPDGIYDYWAGTSSVDPSSAASPDGPFATRYTKDVGHCVAILPVPADGTEMVVEMYNVYPSYHCTIWSFFENQGTVPVKVQSIVTNVYLDPDGTGPMPKVLEMPGTTATWQTLDGTLCGLQIDPSRGLPSDLERTVNTFHLLNAAPQNAVYTMDQVINFVNWNEFDPALCTHTFNGVVQALPLEP
jgi:hypothetical protein